MEDFSIDYESIYELSKVIRDFSKTNFNIAEITMMLLLLILNNMDGNGFTPEEIKIDFKFYCESAYEIFNKIKNKEI